MSNTPHDTLVKAILGKPEHAATALRAIVPAALRDALDWSALRTEPTSYVRVDGGTRHSDLLFAVPLREEPAREALVYVLLEHQSTADPLMALRMFVYVARIFEERVLRAGAARVPLVVPVVLAHGERAWSAVLSLDELYDAPAALVEALGALVPRLTYVLEDVTKLSDDAIEARIADAVVRMTWTVLRDARSAGDLFAYAERLRELIAAVHRQDRSGFASLLAYMFRTKNADLATARRVAAMLPLEAAEDIVNAYDTIKAEGITQGIAQGKAELRRATLDKLLRLKFGPLSDAVRARLDAADEASLDRWTERILFAATLDELFAG